MDRSPGFGSTPSNLIAHLRLAFATAPHLKCLTLLLNVTRWPVLQKVRGHTSNVLPQLVSAGFQVLFHSPPGVLFTFPSRYYSLSVTWSYLAFWDGPHFFRLDFSCPDVLRIPLARSRFRLRVFHPLCSTFPDTSTTHSDTISRSLPQAYYYVWFGLLRFRSPLLSESLLFSFPPGT